jgi:hypothetical protein
MKTVLVLGVLVTGGLASVGCVSSRSVGYVDDLAGSHPFYSETFGRAWAEGRKIVVEVHPSNGPAKVASIGYTVDQGNVYLTHYQISGVRGEKTLMTVDLEVEELPENWRDRLYWLTQEALYPIGSSADGEGSRREPAHRMKITLSPGPEKQKE